MKKAFIVLLVCCIALSAHAVQLSLTADEELPIAYIDGLLDLDVYMGLDSFQGITVELGPAAGPGSGPFEPPPIILPDSPFPPWEQVWILISQTPPVAGTYLNIYGVAGDSVWGAWFDEITGNYGMLGPVTLVPEPTTVALLGLGGIFLLRRRKN